MTTARQAGLPGLENRREDEEGGRAHGPDQTLRIRGQRAQTYFKWYQGAEYGQETMTLKRREVTVWELSAHTHARRSATRTAHKGSSPLGPLSVPFTVT